MHLCNECELLGRPYFTPTRVQSLRGLPAGQLVGRFGDEEKRSYEIPGDHDVLDIMEDIKTVETDE
jgi:hypothetical protein